MTIPVPRETSPLRIRSGSISVLRLIDVAYSIDLKKVEQLWADRRGGASTRARLDSTSPKAMAFGNPPVVLQLDALTLRIDDAELLCGVHASLHEFGAVSLTVHIEVRDMAWDDLLQRNRAVDAQIGPYAATAIWDGLWKPLSEILRPALERPTDTSLREDYSVILVREFDRQLDAESLLRDIDLVPLLTGEQRALSETARQDILRQRFSYYTDDLVVLTWDRAFVYEPHGDSDVLDVLEVANAQLLELRYYDELLDAELPAMYDRVDGARHAIAFLAARRFADLARRLYTLVAEVTELTEKVDNALQVTEDVYLARVYSSALTLFRVPAVAAAVERKLSIIRDTYAALYDEASSRRAELLEIAIVVLIVIEILIAWRA